MHALAKHREVEEFPLFLMPMFYENMSGTIIFSDKLGDEL